MSYADFQVKVLQTTDIAIAQLIEKELDAYTGATSNVDRDNRFKVLCYTAYNSLSSSYTKLKDNMKDSILTGVALPDAGGQTNLIETTIADVVLKMRTPAKRVDTNKFATELRVAGVDPLVIAKALEAATTESAPAKVVEIVAK